MKVDPDDHRSGPTAPAKPSSSALMARMPLRQWPNSSPEGLTAEVMCALRPPRDRLLRRESTAGRRPRPCSSDSPATRRQAGICSTSRIPAASRAGLSTEYGNTAPMPAAAYRRTASGVNADTLMTSALARASPTNDDASACPCADTRTPASPEWLPRPSLRRLT